MNRTFMSFRTQFILSESSPNQQPFFELSNQKLDHTCGSYLPPAPSGLTLFLQVFTYLFKVVVSFFKRTVQQTINYVAMQFSILGCGESSYCLRKPLGWWTSTEFSKLVTTILHARLGVGGVLAGKFTQFLTVSSRSGFYCCKYVLSMLS